MNVVYDAQIFRQQKYGGISRYFCEVAQRLSHQPGVWARILAPHHKNAYASELPPGTLLGWPKPERSQLQGASRLAGRVLVRGAIATIRPDILHETYYSDSWSTPTKTARIMTLHDMIHERFASQFDQNDTTAADKRSAVARADHIICVSEATRQDVMEILGVPAAKLSVIHHGSNLQPAPQVAAAPGAPYLLYVGQRGGYKNFMALVSAAAASPVLRKLQIVCFGGGPLTPAEGAAVDARGLPRSQIVMRSGSDEAMAALYAGALCFVYPSLYEGFGIPPLEAMQCGCPVACSNTSSIPEVVQQAGAYFDPKDIDSMRHTLEELATSPTRCQDLRTLGREQVRRFSWDRCADETLAIYRQHSKHRTSHA
jgi:glycosyltransferase involved in cell wall biosynthesis